MLWDIIDSRFRGLVSLQRFLFRVFVKQLYLTLQLSEVRLLRRSFFFFFPPLLYLSFYPPLVEFTRLFSKCSSSIQTLLSSCCISATLPLRLLHASHADNAITWSQLETVCACQLRVFPSLSPRLPRVIVTLNMDGFWRNLVFSGFNKSEWRNTC